MRTRHTRVLGGVLAALTATALAAGCSTDPSSAPSSSGPSSAPAAAPISAEHTPADIAFAQAMIPHHRQAVAMSAQAARQASSPAVKDLAGRIDAEQGPEIEQMSRMLDTWGAPRPPEGSMSMAMPGMPGMMSDAQMKQLATQSGPAFDRTFLQMMIEHHTGAVQMARTEQARGSNPQARDLAGSIITAQEREIGEMQALLARG